MLGDAVYTMSGARKGKMAPGTCKRVKTGKRGCTIELCKPQRGGRPRFTKGSQRCR